MSQLDQMELRFDWLTESGGQEFFVNGILLRDRFSGVDGYISLFSLLDDEGYQNHIACLIGNAQDMVRSGRTRLLVCSCCGDMGCGGVTMNVTRRGNLVEWANFTREANYEEYGVWPAAPGLSLTFDAGELERALREPFK